MITDNEIKHISKMCEIIKILCLKNKIKCAKILEQCNNINKIKKSNNSYN